MPSSGSAKHSQTTSTKKSSTPSLAEMARAEKFRLHQERLRTKTAEAIPPLLDFIPKVSPHYHSPHHLIEAASRLEAFRTNPFEFVFSVPPRHGKSVLVLHFIVWALKLDPTLRIAYVTYAQNQAEDISGDALKIAREAGLELVRATRAAWETPQGGKVMWTGIGGALTGKGFNIIIVDDPVRNRVEAESPVYRQRAWDFFQSDLYTRLQRGGRNDDIEPSICVIQTRWHADDLAGRLIAGNEDDDVDPWLEINIPAIRNEGTDNEEALWPERWPLKVLHRRRRRVGPYAWASLFQGRPTPRGSSVFGDPCFYVEPPKNFRAAQGLDLSYTSKTSSDYSVIVTMLRETGTERYFVARVRREQKRAPDFRNTIRIEHSAHPRARIRFYASGTELGAADFLRVGQDALPVDVLPPVGDKYTRAIPFAEAWNGERVMVPAPELVEKDPARYGWVNDYLDELKAFTGVKDANDDQVDASVAAYDQLVVPESVYRSLSESGGPKPEGRRM